MMLCVNLYCFIWKCLMCHYVIGECKSRFLPQLLIEFKLFLILKKKKKKTVSHVSIFHPTLNDNDHFDTRLKGWGPIWYNWKIKDQFYTNAKLCLNKQIMSCHGCRSLSIAYRLQGHRGITIEIGRDLKDRMEWYIDK